MKMTEAVSVIIRYLDKIFVIERQEHLSAFPGYTAFPGGKIENKDLDVTNDPFNLEKGHFEAISRELLEEIDWNIKLSLNNIILKKIGVATTPDFNPYRFTTHFYEMIICEEFLFKCNINEIKNGDWKTAEEVLNEYYLGQRALIPPIFKIFKYYKNSSQEPLELKFNFETLPVLETIYGVKQIFIQSQSLPPAIYTNCFLLGDNSDVLVDPSPKNDHEYKKLKIFLADFKIKKILLTHHHPDHCGSANKLALELNVPIFLSRETYHNIKLKNQHWFDHLKYYFIQDMDLLTYSRGLPVLVMAIPGHDNGQLAPYASDFSWFIAGDIFQEQGSVVIGEPEGDMSLYLETLRKIITLSPKFVYPSHGIVLGGVNVLEKILKHRMKREEQVFAYARDKKTYEEMLQFIYPELDERLKRYAMKNIMAHLKKLKIEKRI